MAIPTVAIIGRVNVGKSTLFNRIVGGRTAIVDETPGVTRDRNIGLAFWNDKDFFVIDTGGLAPGSEDPVQSAIERQANLAISEADAIILVVDLKDGLHPFDRMVADVVRRSGVPVFIAANKADKPLSESLIAEFYKLGLGDPWPVSAIHGTGSGDFLDAVTEILPAERYEEDDCVSVAIVGKPNVGKSSLANRICGEERNIVTTLPGTTRDSIDTYMKWQDYRIRLVDTAGLRRRTRKMDDVEFYSTVRTWKSISRGDVVIVVLDGQDVLSHQDIRIISRAWDLGKGLIIGVNKIDLGLEKDRWIESITERYPPSRWIPIVFFSALTGQGVGRLLPEACRISELRRNPVKTSKVNKALREAVSRVQPPSPKGKAIRFFYATQIRKTPPLLLVFVSRPDLLPDNYRKYIENSLRDALSLKGVPLKIVYRKREH